MASSVMEYFRVISIHALREEGDSRATSRAPQSRNFYPRPPRGGRPAGCSGGEKETASISIHALREEGDSVWVAVACVVDIISIHALREEGDSKNRDKISIFL